MRKQPVCHPMVDDGMQPVVEEKDFQLTPRRGIVPLICLYGFF